MKRRKSRPRRKESKDCRMRGEMLGEIRAVAEALQDERAKRGAVIERVKKIAEMIPHEQSEDPSEGMIPTQGCAHCHLLLDITDPEATQAFGALRERERKLRELVTEFENEAVILVKGGEDGRAIATRACAERLRAVLAETEGL